MSILRRSTAVVSREKVSSFTLATLALLALSLPAHAQVSGFTTGFTSNHGGDALHTGDSNDSGNAASVTNNVLTITDNSNSEANSYIYGTKQNITSFTASFTYRDILQSANANGTTFVIENDSLGVNALGGRGGGMGYGSDDSPNRSHNYIGNSAAVALNVYTAQTVGTRFITAGATGTTVGGTFTATGGVSLISGDPINVLLSYNGTVLTETFTDATTAATYTTTNTVNLATVVGGNTAYIGFTGGTGGYNTLQTVSNFSFTPGGSAASPEPGALALLPLGLGLIGVVRRRRRVA